MFLERKNTKFIKILVWGGKLFADSRFPRGVLEPNPQEKLQIRVLSCTRKKRRIFIAEECAYYSVRTE